MEGLNDRHDQEAEIDASALRELDPNAITNTNDPSQTKGQNTETKNVGEPAVDLDEGAMYDDLDNVAQDEDDPNQPTLTAGQAPKKKKKKKRKPKSQRGLGAPTGFEEYYVDTPVTPAEFEEEREIYHQSRTFSERIETAIQRYKAKRNFDSEKKDVFDKYMSFGGIDTGPKMFTGGLDANMLDEHDAKEIRDITATNFVGSDKANIGKDSSIWTVDFEGVVKGFLSSRLPFIYDYFKETQLKSYIAIIRNFLNYLLHHDVCPEYQDQINSARAVCNLADKELWNTRGASWAMPGDFNIACSTLFGGHYQGLYAGNQEWAKGMDLTTGMSDETAWRTFKFGLAAVGDKQAQQFAELAKTSSNKVIKERLVGLEITKVVYADEDTRDFYKEQVPDLRVLGKIHGREWKCPYLPDEDLTEEERAATPPTPEEYELWMEEEVLDVCFVGMKLEGMVRDLNCGVQYIDQVLGIYASFYTFLANERMIGWKAPVLIENSKEEGKVDGDGDDEAMD